jgi:hypothetical protein
VRTLSRNPRIRSFGLTFGGMITAALIALPLNAAAPSQKDKSTPATLRWAEGQPGCTFSRDNDGKYRYALWTDDYGVIVAVDSQELQLVHKRSHKFFGVQLTVRYRGKDKLFVDARRATLQFIKHEKLVQSALDPEVFAAKIQSAVDNVEHDTAREIKKHPERREKREQFVQDYQKEAIELIDFVTQRTLTAVELDSARSQADGWLLFSTDNKWIGDWKRPEEFLLRIPVGHRLLEFPFALPPHQGDLILRQRPN